jgi:hypothetical protein
MMSAKPESPIAYELASNQVELALVALYVFDQLREGSTLSVAELTQKALDNWEIERLSQDPDFLGKLADQLWNPLYDSRLTAADHLRIATRDLDLESSPDDEIDSILRDIVAKHGPITQDDFEQAFAS